MSLFSRKNILMASLCGWALLAQDPAKAQIATYYDNNVIVDLSVLEDNGFRAAPSFGIPSQPAQMPPTGNPQSQFFGLPSGVTQPGTAAASQPASRLKVPSAQPQSRIVLQQPQSPRVISREPSQPVLPTQRLSQSPAPKPVSAPTQLVEKPKPEMVKEVVAQPAPVQIVTPTPAPKPAPAPSVRISAPVPAPKPTPAPVKPVVSAAQPKPVETVKADMKKPQPGLTPPAPTVTKAPEQAVAPKALEKTIPAPAAVMADAPPPAPADIVQPRDVSSAIKAQEAQQTAPQAAALTSAGASSARITFDPGVSQFPTTSENELNSLAQTLIANPNDRVQLLAYAGGENLSASKARRLSLSRALAIRTHLIEQGVRSTRIDVRALGNKTTQEPLNRVDVQILAR